MSHWISDLWHQRMEVKNELWELEQDLKIKREEMEQLKLEASGLTNAGPVVTSSVSGLSKGATAETRTPQKKRSKQKSHPVLSSEE